MEGKLAFLVKKSEHTLSEQRSKVRYTVNVFLQCRLNSAYYITGEVAWRDWNPLRYYCSTIHSASVLYSIVPVSGMLPIMLVCIDRHYWETPTAVLYLVTNGLLRELLS